MADPHMGNRPCSDWAEITKWLEEFPPPEMSIDWEGSIFTTAWVFRGLKSSSYKLQPMIEREAQAKSMEWAALETLVSSEFKARARTHLSAPLIPEDELSWLAQMQHYAIPTRLLDFTYSPFVALYFAIRNCHESSHRTSVRLWAVNAREVNNRFWRVVSEASVEDKKRKGKYQSSLMSLNPDDCATHRDSMITETQDFHTLIAKSLSARGTYRAEMKRKGCICSVSPLAFNPRLINQQGVFLLNCAEDISFEESLNKMMEPCSGWYKTFDIDIGLIPEIEERLFQMNIHEQSLFPDMEGLAGLIRQKIRLHWR